MKFYIKQKVFSLKDKFKIFDANETQQYQVEGKFFSFRNELELQNTNGSVVYKANKKVFSFMPKYYIYDIHHVLIAEINKKFSLRPSFRISIDNEIYQVQGTMFGHSFDIFDGVQTVASISKKVISWGDTYEIDIQDEQKVELYLFIVIIIDQIIHERQSKRYS